MPSELCVVDLAKHHAADTLPYLDIFRNFCSCWHCDNTQQRYVCMLCGNIVVYVTMHTPGLCPDLTARLEHKMSGGLVVVGDLVDEVSLVAKNISIDWHADSQSQDMIKLPQHVLTIALTRLRLLVTSIITSRHSDDQASNKSIEVLTTRLGLGVEGASEVRTILLASDYFAHELHVWHIERVSESNLSEASCQKLAVRSH